MKHLAIYDYYSKITTKSVKLLYKFSELMFEKSYHLVS